MPVVAYNAKEGIDAAEKLHPDLILMDIKMPGETGTDAALEIKQNPGHKGYQDRVFEQHQRSVAEDISDRDKLAKELGMEDYIDKTADLNTIVAKVKEILARK